MLLKMSATIDDKFDGNSRVLFKKRNIEAYNLWLNGFSCSEISSKMDYSRQRANTLILSHKPSHDDLEKHYKNYLYIHSKNRESLKIYSLENLYKFIDDKVDKHLFVHEIAKILGCSAEKLEQTLIIFGYEIVESDWREEIVYRRLKKKKERVNRKRKELISWGEKMLNDSDDFNPEFLQTHHTGKWSQIWKTFGSMDDYYIALGYEPSSLKVHNYPKHRDKIA